MEVIDRNTYLNGINSFLDYYLKKLSNDDEIDIKYFYELKDFIVSNLQCMNDKFLNVMMETLDYNEFKHIGYFPSPKPSTFIKLYMISKAFMENFHDIENYKAILEDINGFDDYSYVYNFDSKFKLNRYVIDAMVGFKYYKDIPNFRKLFAKLYDYFNWTSGSYNFDYDYRLVNMVIREGKELGIDKDRYLDIANKVLEVGEPLFVHSRPYLYSKLLLPGKRFEYLNNKLNEIEGNYFLRKNIFSYISNLSLGMFDDFKEDDDYFISCMNIVFDSDSYEELSNKLNIIREASYCYENGDSKKARSLINSLTDLSNKKVYCDSIVSYPVDCVNHVKKPSTILERERFLYKGINDSICYDFMSLIHYNSENIGGFNRDLDKVLKKENSSINVFKRKIKNKFEKKKSGVNNDI